MGKKERFYDSARFEVLAAVYAKAGTQVDHGNVGAYRTKYTRAGEYLYVDCYPLIGGEARQRQAAELERLKRDPERRISAKYARYNNARRQRVFEQIVHANFGDGSFHVACTYPVPEDIDCGRSDAEYRDREQAKRDVDNYIRRIKRLLKKTGHDPAALKYIKVTVTKEYDKEARRPFPDAHHHHLLLHGVPEELRGEIERLWPFGWCNADRLQPNDQGVARMAGYISRQEGRANGDHAAGEKSWSGSKNLVRPEVTTSDRKISRRRVMQIAEDVRANGREVFAKVWPEYRLTDEPVVWMSDFVAGAYIRARLRWAKSRDGDERRRRKG